MPSNHLARTTADPLETLRRLLARTVRLHESGAWQIGETLNGLSLAAIAAVAGEAQWTGDALSPDQVVEAFTSLPAGLRSRLHAHLLEKEDVYWSDVRLVLPAGGPPGRFSESFLDAAKRLREHLCRVATPPATA